MAQEAPNSSANINLAHDVSIWFRKDWTGEYYELGDCVVDGISLTPEFTEFRSYRNGIYALRKKLLTNREASVSATLNEPNIRNLQRVIYGGAVASGQSATIYDGKHLEIKTDAGGQYVDLADAGETDFGNITVVSIYEATDVMETTDLLESNVSPDTDGHAYIPNFTDFSDTAAVGDTVYVRYEVTVSSMRSSEIFGASQATIEGAAQLQARNLQGGVQQIWSLASVTLSPNGDLTYAVDTPQSVPILMSLQERSGTFGTLYTK